MIKFRRKIALLLATLMLLGSFNFTALDKPVYAQDIESKPLTLRPRDIVVGDSWSPGQNKDDEINRSSVKLNDRFRGHVINPRSSDEAKIQVLSLMNSKATTKSSVGAEGFKTYAFDNWQYTDSMIFWDGKVPTPDVIDAAHRNGVPIYGTLFFNWSATSEDQRNLLNFLREDSPGSKTFPEARKYVDIAKYYGFDGYFINQETTGPLVDGKGQTMRDLMLYMKKYAEEQQYPIRLSWYDAMTNNGPRNHFNAINGSNDFFVKPDEEGRVPADEFFINFNWSKGLNQSSGSHMESIGRSKFDGYAGFELQQNSINTNIRFNQLVGDDKKAIISIGLFTPDSILGFSKDGEDYHIQERNFWTGYEGDPSISNDISGWVGMSRFVSDSSPITSLPFKSYFNTGHGRKWFENGELSRTYDWNARGVSEILPTWRWWIQSSGTKLQAKYDFDDAYYGGNSIKFYGLLDSENIINLYSTKFEASSDTMLDVTAKGGLGSEVYVGVSTDKDYATFAYSKLELGEDWTTTKVDLSDYAGQTITAINIKVSGSSSNYSFNLGEISVYNDSTVVSSPENVKVTEHLLFDSKNSEALIRFDRVSGADYYVVYADNGEKFEFIQASSSNIMYLPNIIRTDNNTGNIQKLKVVTIGLNGTVSEGTEYELDWKMNPNDTGSGIQVDPLNVVLGATVTGKSAEESGEKAENALNGTITGNSDKWTVAWARSGWMSIRLKEEKTVRRWRVEHAGHGGESVNDGLMNTRDFDLQYKDSNGEWKVAKTIKGNKAHVTDVNLDSPITASEWKLNISTADNGSPWGAIRIYNWMMFEEELDLTTTSVIPMSQVTVDHVEGDNYKVIFRNVPANTKVEILSNKDGDDVIDSKSTSDKQGHLVFDMIELAGDSGLMFYRSKANDKENSNILAKYYEKTKDTDNVETEPIVSCELVQEKLTVDNIVKTQGYFIDRVQAKTPEANLIDGDDNSIVWYGNPGNRYREGDYIGLDLKEVKKLGIFRFVSGGIKAGETPQSGPAGDYFKSYRVRYSNDLQTWSTFGETIEQNTYRKVNEIDFTKEDISARYVVVEAATNENKWVRFGEMSISTRKCDDPMDSLKKPLNDRVKEIESEYEQLTRSKTRASLIVLNEKLIDAKRVLDKQTVNQSEVNSALIALNSAYNLLIDKGPIPQVQNPFGDQKAKLVSVDAGRKYFSVAQIKQIIDAIESAGYTHLHLLLGNDGMRFLLNDMTVTTMYGTYPSENVKSGITAGNAEYAARKGLTDNASSSLSQAEMEEILEYAKMKKIEIIPAINSPGHMDAILTAMKNVGISEPNFTYNGRRSVTTLDIDKKEVVEFAKEFTQLYVDFFSTRGVKVFNFGADEYANDAFQNPGWGQLVNLNKYDKFVDYANDLSERILRAGMRPMAYNDGFYYRGANNPEFNNQLIIALWTAGWSGFNVAPSTTFIQKGHDVVNVNDSWYYVLGREASGSYNRQSALRNMRAGNRGFSVNVGTKIETIGSMISVWADEPSREFEFDKFKEWVDVFSESNPDYFTRRFNLQELQTLVQLSEIFLSIDDVDNQSYRNLKEALREAKEVLEDPQSQERVDQATNKLKAAMDNLDKEPDVEIDKEQLLNQIVIVENALEDLQEKITTESLERLTNALAEAKSVYENNSATQEQVNEALNELKEAFENIEMKETPPVTVNKETLINTVKIINNLFESVKDKFTTETVENLEINIRKSQQIIENSNVSQDDVDNAIVELNQAFSNLEVKENEDIQEVDPTILESMIVNVKKILANQIDNLTEKSRVDLQNSLDEAVSVAEDSDTIQDDIDKQVSKLLEAISNLEFIKSDVKPTQPNKDLLKNIVNTAKNKLSEDLEEESRELLQAEINKAEEILESDLATVEQVDEITNSLIDALLKVKVKVSETPKKANKDFLDLIIKDAEKILENDLKEDVKQNLITSLQKAKDVLDKEDATQHEVNTAFEQLLSSIIDSYDSNKEDEKDRVDTSMLEELIKDAEKTLEKDITEEAKEKLNSKILKAKGLILEDNLTKENLDMIFIELFDALVEAQLSMDMKDQSSEPKYKLEIKQLDKTLDQVHKDLENKVKKDYPNRYRFKVYKIDAFNKENQQVTELDEKVTVEIKLSELEYSKDDKEVITIYNNHNDEILVIENFRIDEGKDLLIFENDKFSDFVFVSGPKGNDNENEDTQKESSEETMKETTKESAEETKKETSKESSEENNKVKPVKPGSQNGGNTSSKNRPVSNPSTGDQGIAIFALLTTVGVGCLYLLQKKKKVK